MADAQNERMARAPRVAVVGAGHWGRNLVRNFAALGVLDAVADARAEVAASLAQQHGARVATFAEILADPRIDAVALATPATQHAEMTCQALAAGKHVFVEKPIALTVADGERSIEAAAAADRVLMVGHLLQYHPAFIELKRRIEAGELGRLRYIYSNRMSLGQIRQEENALWSFAPHDVSMILSLAKALPQSVQALGHSYVSPEIADVTHTHLTFADGLNAHILVSWLHPFKEHKLVAIGADAMMVFDDTQPWSDKLQLYRHKVTWEKGSPVPVKAAGEAIPLEDAEPLKLECAHFIERVRDGRTPRTDGREALGVLRVLAAAQRSIDEHRPVRIADETATPPPHPGATIHQSSFVDEGATIGHGTKIWHFSHILSGVTIGRDCSFGQNVVVGPDVTIGDGCKVQNNVSLYKGVTLEDGVFCGPSCVFTNVLTPRAEISRADEFKPTTVRRGASIGANATIVCGHELGEYCLIAAGSVVTRDVPAYALMAGVPARRIGWVSRSGDRLGDDLVCPREGVRYEQTGPDSLRPIG